MCTVTIVRYHTGDGAPAVRIVCNRDEKRTRPPCLPPRAHTAGNRTTIYPVDPASGGTWIGVNNAGIAACLLNANPPLPAAPRRPSAASRGGLVPAALLRGDIAEAMAAAEEALHADMPPFVLLAVDAGRVATMSWDGDALTRTDACPLVDSLMLTSSSLGDDAVQAPRRAMLEQALAGSADLQHAQDRFHAHFCPDAPHLGVLMSRPDARTVSRTTVTIASGEVRMRHVRLNDALRPHAPAVPIRRPLITPAPR